MTDQKKTIKEQDTIAPENIETSGEFVMPESDGIVSGHPLADKDQAGYGTPDITPEGFNQRMLDTTGSLNETAGFHGQIIQDTTSAATSGMTIKTKLVGSLALLTLIIVLVGGTAFFSLKKINFLSVGISQNYAKLAKVSEEIKSSVYKMRDAEKDFLILEEPAALDKVTRFTAQLRQQTKEATAIGQVIEESSGIAITSQFASLVTGTDEYESLFAEQVKNIKKARTDINASLAEIKSNEAKLMVEVTSNRLLIKNLIDDYWFAFKGDLDKSQSEKTESFNLGLLMSSVEKELYNTEIQIAKYLDSEKKSFALAAKSFIASTLGIINQARRLTLDDRILLKLEGLRKNLVMYEVLFDESVDNTDKVFSKKALIDVRIAAQKDELKEIGDQLLSYAIELTDANWGIIAAESTKLRKAGSTSQNFLLVVVIASTILGILVLIFIPRPILASVDSLLISSRSVAQGDLSRKIEVNSRDELGLLGSSFEVMRRNLVSLVNRIQLASAQITTTVNEIQTAANQQSSTALEQSTSLNQFSSTLTEITETAENLFSISAQVSKDTTKTAGQVEDSNNKSSQVLESMNTISSSTSQTSDRIKSLNDQMDAINEAVSMISGIADQTTLLSLNAAIEANKAGEMGKGFSIVASEIRTLSDRSIDSASGINGMVRDIQRATESSVVAMDKSSEEIKIGIDRVRESVSNLGSINDAVNALNVQIEDINNSSQAQAVSSRMVQQTTVDLIGSSRIAAQAARQTAGAATELNAMANQLRDAVAQFKLS